MTNISQQRPDKLITAKVSRLLQCNPSKTEKPHQRSIYNVLREVLIFNQVTLGFARFYVGHISHVDIGISFKKKTLHKSNLLLFLMVYYLFPLQMWSTYGLQYKVLCYLHRHFPDSSFEYYECH